MTHDNKDSQNSSSTHSGNGTETEANLNSDPEATNKINFTEELDKARAEAERYKNDYLYLKAEFDTYKRNAIKERSDLLKFGSERVLVDLLDVVDNFERALQVDVNSQNYPSFRKGVDMIADEFRTVLQKFGLKEVPSEGQAFDPNIHEALTSEESSNVPPGHVTKVFRKAYKLHDKVVRTGQVVVAREPSSSSTT